MLNDRIARLDPNTGQFVEYLFHRFTNVRRVFVEGVDDAGSLLNGQQPGASIIKLEPLD
jgi:hypothetical protein